MIAPSPTIEAIRLDPNYAVAFHNRGIAIASEANALNQHRLSRSWGNARTGGLGRPWRE
jgi:hypothetical protein